MLRLTGTRLNWSLAAMPAHCAVPSVLVAPSHMEQDQDMLKDIHLGVMDNNIGCNTWN